MERINTPKNVDIVETENAIFRVIRSDHRVPNTLEELGGAEIFCIEAVIEDLSQTGFALTEMLAGTFLNLFERSTQLKKIRNFTQIKSLHIVDTFLIEDIEEKVISEIRIARRNFLIGGVFSVAGFYNILFGKKLEKVIGGGEVVLGAYLARLELTFRMIMAGSKNKILSKVEKEHFLLSLAIRNLIIANKVSYIADLEFSKSRKRGEVAVAVGAGHGLVTEALKLSKKDRQELFNTFLQSALDRGIISNTDNEEMERSFYFIPSLDFKNKQLKMLDTRVEI